MYIRWLMDWLMDISLLMINKLTIQSLQENYHIGTFTYG